MKNSSKLLICVLFNASMLFSQAFIINAKAQIYDELLKAVPSELAAYDSYGVSVCISGDIAFIGANGDDGAGGAAGAVYVFELKDGTWKEVQKLYASDAADWDNFGCGVSVSGSWAIVGANQNDDAGGGSGSAYIFVFSGGSWIESQKITALDAADGDSFGFSVSISGNNAIVSAHLDDDGGDMAGSAYIFEYGGSEWTQTAKLNASDPEQWDQFGNKVAISGDIAIVGSSGSDDGGNNSGSAYIFEKNGATWTQTKKLTPADARSDDHFGVSVAISDETALIGAYGEDLGSFTGSAYFFDKVDDIWIETQKITASDAAENDNFGCSVSISGNKAILGAYGEDEAHIQSGAAYTFEVINGTWTETQKLNASDADRNDWFGNAVSISGNTAMVGASGKTDLGLAGTGAAYIFRRRTAGIADNTLASQVKVFPNPTLGKVNIDFGNLLDPSIEVYTMQGKLIFEKNKINASNYSIQLDDNSMVYLLKVISQDKSTIIKLVRE